MKKEKNRPILAILLPYMAKYKGRIILSVILLVLARVFSIADPFIIKLLVDYLVEGLPEGLAFVVILIALFFILRWGADLLDGVKEYIFAKAETNIKKMVSLDVFNHLMSLSVDFHTSRSTGGVTRKIARGSSGLEMFLFFFTSNIVPTFIEITLVIVVFLVLFPPTFSLVVVAFVVAFVSYTIYITDKRQKVLLEANLLDDEASGRSIDALMNYETVKYFNNEQYEHTRYENMLSRWVTMDIRGTKMGANLNMGQSLIITIGITALLALAIREYLNDAATIGDLVLVTTYMARIATPMTFLGFVYRRIKEGLADTDEMLRLLKIQNNVPDSPEAEDLTDVAGQITFKNVSFSYESNRTILNDVSFVCETGKRTAFVGHSGSGKSTVAKLLLRFYDVNSGEILIDGRNIKDVTQRSLRDSIGVVAQDTILFNDTIYNNILYGDPDVGEEKVKEAARIAGIESLIENELPDGYNTMVGERGVRLSGGEKQRVAIARMILKRPPVLLFDEATASLDTKSEKQIQRSIEEISKEGRTTLMIAHRLSTVIDFDTIVVMDNGEIVESGTHEELLALNGHYAELWLSQRKKSDSSSSGTSD